MELIELQLAVNWALSLQQLGRVDRRGTATLGSNTYKIHVNVNSYISLFLRCMQTACPIHCKLQLNQLHEVVEFLMIPATCYHCKIEEYFEWVDRERFDCVHFCSK